MNMRIICCKIHNTNFAKQIQINTNKYKTNSDLKKQIGGQFNLFPNQFQLENLPSEQKLLNINEIHVITLKILNPISDIFFRFASDTILINNCIQKDFDGIIHQFNQQNIFFSKLLLNPLHLKFKIWDFEIPRKGFFFNCIPEGTFIDVEPHNIVILNYRYFKFIFIEGESVNNAIRLISFYLKGATFYSIQSLPDRIELSGNFQLSSKQNYKVQITNNFTFWQINKTPFVKNFDFLITVDEFKKKFNTESQLSSENIIVYRKNSTQIANDNDRLIDVLTFNQQSRKFIVFFDIQKVQTTQIHHQIHYPIIPPAYEISQPSEFKEIKKTDEMVEIHFIIDNGYGLDFTQNVKFETKISELVSYITSVYQFTERIEIAYKDRMTNKTVILDRNKTVFNYVNEMKSQNENRLYVEIDTPEKNDTNIINIDHGKKQKIDDEFRQNYEILKVENEKLEKENIQLKKLLSKKEEEITTSNIFKSENTDLKNEIAKKDEQIQKMKKYIKKLQKSSYEIQMKEEKSMKQKEKENDDLKRFNHYLFSRLCKYEKAVSYEEFISGIDFIQDDPPSHDLVGAEDEKYHEIISKIGEGATSDVFKIVDKRTGETMCKKIIKICKDDASFKTLQNSLKEIEVQQSIFHPCICKALGYNLHEEIPRSTKTTVALFFELLPYDVKNIASNGMLNNTLKARIAVEVAFGMSYIHSNGIMHRDLKLDNIMLNDVLESKIIDFGLVHVPGLSGPGSLLTKGIGTLAYMSPEMLNEEDYNEKTDVYSYGIVLFEMFTGSLPKQKMRDKMNKIAFECPKASPEISEYCIGLIKKCTSFEPSKRPSFDQIINEMEENSFDLASEIDKDVVIHRYKELNRIRTLSVKSKNACNK